MHLNQFFFRVFQAICLAALMASPAGLAQEFESDTSIRIMTLNLHGYHPYQKDIRFTENRDGHRTPVSPNPYFFTEGELEHGNQRRLDDLAGSIYRIQPDVILFQEVGAGWADTDKNCAIFEQRMADETRSENTVYRLERRLHHEGYRAAVGCRGNVGWSTTPSNFRDQRIVAQDWSGNWRVVHDFNTNPYPRGLLVEGFGLLVRQPWFVLTNQMIGVDFNRGEEHRFQFAVIGHPDRPLQKLVLVNLHGDHKVRHFEHAVAMRQWVDRWLAEQSRREPSTKFSLIVGGDFNSRIYDGSHRPFTSEVSTLPWQIRWPGRFDFSIATNGEDNLRKSLRDRLMELNWDQSYKSDATIHSASEAENRIGTSVSRYIDWQKTNTQRTGELWPSYFAEGGLPRCNPRPDEAGSCNFYGKIDHILYDPHTLSSVVSEAVYNDSHGVTTASYSDHPGIIAEFVLKR